MSDTPTFANLLTQWSGGNAAERQSVYAHLRSHPAEAVAVETSMRDELNSVYPSRCVIAAEAIIEVYQDEDAAALALRGVFRHGDSSAAVDAVSVLQKLSPQRAGPLLIEFAIHAPAVFRSQSTNFHRWAGSTVIQTGDEAPHLWLTLLGHAGAEVELPLLMGLADAAPRVPYDLSAIEPAVQSRLRNEGVGYAAGAALWRLTWRVNHDWLETINASRCRSETNCSLLALLVEVLTEHLGREPSVTGFVRDQLVWLSYNDQERFRPLVKRLAKLGGRGWAVLLPLSGELSVDSATRTAVFNEAVSRPAVLVLVQHHAHAVVLERERERNAVPLELLQAAVGVLRAIGAPAGSALGDVFNLIVKEPFITWVLTPAIPALMDGYPNPIAALARTLDRLRASLSFRPDAFAALADVYAARNLDGAPLLVEDTSFDPRTSDLLLQQPTWKDAAPEVRRRHAIVLADRLASPRAEVRSRAASLLRHYSDQLPVVWPALVALLAGNDEKAVQLVLPYFRSLTPVAEAVIPELLTLFHEPSPTYAARAVVALWRLGQMSTVADELRSAVLNEADDARGWAVLRGVVDRVFQTHGLLNDLSRLFASSPPEVVAKIHALLNPPETPEETAIAAHVSLSYGSATVNWNGVHQCVGNDAEGGFLFLALMCAFGSEGFSGQKIWMIKHQRTTAGTGLAEAKGIVERAIERLTIRATAGDKQACVREYFRTHELPKSLTDLLDHRLSWYRWAGLELLDAWGSPELIPAWIEDRIWDRSAFVRARALRMQSG